MNPRLIRIAPAVAVAAALLTAPAFAQHMAALPSGSPSPAAAGSPSPAPSAYILPDPVSAQTHPVPVPTAKPGQLSVSGRLRAYDYQKLNKVQTAATPNKKAFELGAEPHFDYRIGSSPVNIGYTYFASTGFGFNGPNPITNPKIDNTLPGYPLNSPIHELYVQYKDAQSTVTIGDQELNYAWTPNSDVRIMPASYQAFDGTLQVSRNISAGLTQIVRFENRNSSAFVDNTLLTAPYPGTSSLYPAAGIETPGTLRTSLRYQPVSNFSLLAENYAFYDIADLVYTEAKVGLVPSSSENPYLAVQYVAENAIGRRQAGIIDNQTYGAQIGVNVSPHVLFAASSDISPWHYALVRASSAAAAQAGYLVGDGGTGDAALVSHGLYRVAYGGIASPYTDSLGTDALYTTMTQNQAGMPDRRSAGNSYRTTFVYTSPNKQFKFAATEAWYQYSNQIARNITTVNSGDATYYFNRVRSGPYKGFFARIRIEPRTQPTVPYKYVNQRFISEYDF